MYNLKRTKFGSEYTKLYTKKLSDDSKWIALLNKQALRCESFTTYGRSNTLF